MATLADIVSLAQSQLGKGYQYGAASNSALTQFYYDCSSLVQSIFAHAGISLPRTSQQQAGSVTQVSNPQPGDLVFASFQSLNDHVGIYLGNGQVLSALDEAHGVNISNVANWPGAWFGGVSGVYSGSSPSSPPASSGGSSGGSNSPVTSFGGAQWHTVLIATFVVGMSVYLIANWHDTGGWVYVIILLLAATLVWPNFSSELMGLRGNTSPPSRAPGQTTGPY